MQNVYETIIIFKDDLPETKYEQLLFNIKATGLILDKDLIINDIGIKKLAYVVKDYYSGKYFSLKYITEAENISYIEQYLRSHDEILKFITIKSELTIHDFIKEKMNSVIKTKDEIDIYNSQVDLLKVIYGLAKFKTKGDDAHA